jgi:hypothetical protein
MCQVLQAAVGRAHPNWTFVLLFLGFHTVLDTYNRAMTEDSVGF